MSALEGDRHRCAAGVDGAWNATSVATVGRFLASSVLGASAKSATSDFETALIKDPANPAHPAFYALSMLALSTDYTPRVTQLLHLVAKLPARDAYETMLAKSCASVLALLASGDQKGAQALAQKLLPFGRLG